MARPVTLIRFRKREAYVQILGFPISSDNKTTRVSIPFHFKKIKIKIYNEDSARQPKIQLRQKGLSMSSTTFHPFK